jgi:glycosyltransferase involved in cell wall biosynthesis
MLLSIIVPVFNESGTIDRVIDVIRAVPVQKEIIIVDDGSADGTRELLKTRGQSSELRVIFHEKNQGKGSAVRTGIREAKGDIIIIQDADLEYDPMDYLPMLEAMKKSGSRVVYGSRFLDKKKVTSGWHRAVNFFLTFLTNALYGSTLTDMETCYKLLSAPLLKGIPLESSGFEIEVELTAKVLRLKERVVEVPISYKGRSFHEGKKIGWKDGLKAVSTLWRYRYGRG